MPMSLQTLLLVILRILTLLPSLQDVDIKKQAGNNPYAFIQFVELSSAIQARRRMDREFVGRNRVKVQN